MVNSLLYHKTIDFITTLRDSSDVKESEYRQVLTALCDAILHEDVAKIQTYLEDIEKSKKKCGSCGIELEKWEKEVCGPCKVNDHRIRSESDFY